VAGGWGRLRNEELHNLHVSIYIIKMVNSRSMRWARLVARTEETEKCKKKKKRSENLKGRDNSEDLGIDGRILEWEGEYGRKF
jgi:hypothetical protein